MRMHYLTSNMAKAGCETEMTLTSSSDNKDLQPIGSNRKAREIALAKQQLAELLQKTPTKPRVPLITQKNNNEPTNVQLNLKMPAKPRVPNRPVITQKNKIAPTNVQLNLKIPAKPRVPNRPVITQKNKIAPTNVQLNLKIPAKPRVPNRPVITQKNENEPTNVQLNLKAPAKPRVPNRPLITQKKKNELTNVQLNLKTPAKPRVPNISLITQQEKNQSTIKHQNSKLRPTTSEEFVEQSSSEETLETSSTTEPTAEKLSQQPSAIEQKQQEISEIEQQLEVQPRQCAALQQLAQEITTTYIEIQKYPQLPPIELLLLQLGKVQKTLLEDPFDLSQIPQVTQQVRFIYNQLRKQPLPRDTDYKKPPKRKMHMAHQASDEKRMKQAVVLSDHCYYGQYSHGLSEPVTMVSPVNNDFANKTNVDNDNIENLHEGTPSLEEITNNLVTFPPHRTTDQCIDGLGVPPEVVEQTAVPTISNHQDPCVENQFTKSNKDFGVLKNNMSRPNSNNVKVSGRTIKQMDNKGIDDINFDSTNDIGWAMARRAQLVKNVLGSTPLVYCSQIKSMNSFDLRKVVEEFETLLPDLYHIILCVMVKRTSTQEPKLTDSCIPRLALIYGIIMMTRNQNMSMVQRVLAVTLCNSAVAPKVLDDLQHYGVCVGYHRAMPLLETLILSSVITEKDGLGDELSEYKTLEEEMPDVGLTKDEVDNLGLSDVEEDPVGVKSQNAPSNRTAITPTKTSLVGVSSQKAPRRRKPNARTTTRKEDNPGLSDVNEDPVAISSQNALSGRNVSTCTNTRKEDNPGLSDVNEDPVGVSSQNAPSGRNANTCTNTRKEDNPGLSNVNEDPVGVSSQEAPAAGRQIREPTSRRQTKT